MAQKRVVAPDTPITAYPTPEIANIVITVDVDSRLPGYKALEYGTLYPDQTRYPGAKLIAQTPLEDDRFVRRIYATDRIKQETYNYAIKFSAGSPDHPIYTRTFIESRDTYTPLPDNSPDSVIPGAYLVDEEAAPAGGELNNLYLEVTRIYETLPGPWVPSSRYDDDLGLVQTRRRSVVNEGQVATLSADKRVSYEARDGSTGVYIELEESWSIAPDDEGNSLFPIRDRDFYDASRGPVQERRQLFVPTGNEQGTLENVDGVITQTSYEPYNEYLSAKVIQTYSVDGPQLVGQATNNEGQLVTITTQRKGADGYTVPSPTATRTVEVSREDAESLVERVVDTPEIFGAQVFSIERPDPAPQKFRVELPTTTEQETVEGTAEEPMLGGNDLSKSEQQQTKFTKRTSTTKRDATPSGTLIGKQTGTWGDETVTETYDEDGSIVTGHTILSHRKTPLGGGKFLGEKVQVESPISLVERKKDAETGIIFTTTKTLVPAGSPLPTTSANEIAEITPIDAYNSVQIITSVGSLPSPETFESSIDVSYPDVLQSIGIEWDVQTGGSAGSSGISNIATIISRGLSWESSANATASAQVVGAVYAQITRGHRGSVRANVTRTYYYNPPSNIPLVQKFNPVYGTITIKGKGVRINNSTSVGGSGDAQSGSSSGGGFTLNTFIDSIQIGPFCHSNPPLQNPVSPNGTSATFTASGGSVPAGAYPATSATATASATATLTVGASSPSGSSLTTGFSHIAAVRVEKWRFGIWIQEVYTAYHP